MFMVKVILVSVMAVALLASSSGFDVKEIKENNRDWKMSTKGRSCTFCEFFEETSLTPYELLWKVGSEIFRGLSRSQLSLMLMNPQQLRTAEYVFEEYCSKLCQRARRQILPTYSCDDEYLEEYN